MELRDTIQRKMFRFALNPHYIWCPRIEYNFLEY